MALSEKARNKQSAAAVALLPAGSTFRGYVVGRASARITTQAIVVSAVFAALFLVVLEVAHTVLIPGLLVIFYVAQVTRPPRGVAVTDQGLALLARSVWTGKPNEVVTLMGPIPVLGPEVSFGAESVKLQRAELDRLRNLTSTWNAQPPPGFAPLGVVPPPPPPPAAFP
jgi:hypothetical protein